MNLLNLNFLNNFYLYTLIIIEREKSMRFTKISLDIFCWHYLLSLVGSELRYDGWLLGMKNSMELLSRNKNNCNFKKNFITLSSL